MRFKALAKKLGVYEKYQAALKAGRDKALKLAGIKARKQITLYMLDKSTYEVLKVFSSITEASNYLQKRSAGPITNAINFKRTKTGYGYVWASPDKEDFNNLPEIIKTKIEEYQKSS